MPTVREGPADQKSLRYALKAAVTGSSSPSVTLFYELEASSSADVGPDGDGRFSYRPGDREPAVIDTLFRSQGLGSTAAGGPPGRQEGADQGDGQAGQSQWIERCRVGDVGGEWRRTDADPLRELGH